LCTSSSAMAEAKNCSHFTSAGGHGGVRTRRAATANGLAAPFARTDIRKYSFAVRTVEHWNSLPEGARTANSQQSFKELLKNIKMYALLDRPGRSH
jgi:hypothetical protein